MIPRDRFMSPEYWNDYIQFLEVTIHRFEQAVARPENTIDDQHRLRWAVWHYRLELLIAQYSAGADIAALQHAYPTVIDALETYLEVRGRPFDWKVLDKYVEALWLVALAILLDRPDTDLERVVRVLNNTGRDALFERLVGLRLSQQLLLSSPFPAPLLHPRPYEFLYRALDADGPECEVLIAQFLKRYYRGMRHAYWHDRHLSTDTGFFGYWCFELAAFVKLLHIPDHSFANNIYYPSDLVVLSDARS